MAISLTGSGKLLVCNRLFGDSRTIEDISGATDAHFRVCEIGKTASETIASQMKTVESDVEIKQGVKSENLNFNSRINFKLCCRYNRCSR